MNSTLAVSLLVVVGSAGTSQVPGPAYPANPAMFSTTPANMSYEMSSDPNTTDGGPNRAFLQSDTAFPNFIGPISNPVLAKDPRALTEARLLFVQDWIPRDNALGGGNFQLYGLQVRVALTDRLSFIADKDGIASIHPGAGPSETGLVNLAGGFKYAFIRDVEDQFLVTGGIMFEPQTGESKVFQGQGSGLFSFFGTVGKEFGACYHFVGNAGYQQPLDESQNSSFFYMSAHFDKQLYGWLYPLVEANWYHWTTSGDRGLPSSVGEGDGLLNLGTSGVAGNDLVTLAVGLKAKLNEHIDIGAAYERPVSNPKDLIDNRVLAEFILRF